MQSFFIEPHVYKHSRDVWKYVIFAKLKNCKVKWVVLRFDAKLQMHLEAVMSILVLVLKDQI